MRPNNPKHPVTIMFPLLEYEEMIKEKDRMKMSWNQAIYEWFRVWNENKKEVE